MFKSIKAMGFAFAAAIAAQAGVADATILNISSTDATGVAIDLFGGHTYQVDWIGTASGGLYDAAQENGAYTDSVAFRDPYFSSAFQPGGATTVNLFTVGPIGSMYATASASLNAYQTGMIDVYDIDINSGVVSPPVLGGTVQSGFTHTIDPANAGTFHVVVFDGDGNRTGNTGGVSLRITDVTGRGAVPEPASWALMIGGFALAGVALRRRTQGVAT